MQSLTTDVCLFLPLCSGKMEYTCGVQTENDPVDVQFRYKYMPYNECGMCVCACALYHSTLYSKSRSHLIYTLEKASNSLYDSCVYEYGDGKVYLYCTIPSFFFFFSITNDVIEVKSGTNVLLL